MNKSVGTVKTEYFTFDELLLEGGEKLAPVTIAYETYGRLNERKSNAILLLHALTGDAHAAGFHKGDDKPAPLRGTASPEFKYAAGWWDEMTGPGKAFDTDKYFVICSNILGGCKGTTGPSSINPKTGRPYALDFPVISIGDMVNAQVRLIGYFGIDRLLSVAGGSMGGMQALEWAVSHPEKVRSAIPIATAVKHSPQQIAFNEVGRQAIMADVNWKNGNYYDGAKPARGLSVARMVGHITYMSDKSMEEKFGRQFRDGKFEVEGYLHYRGDTFVKRFDANSYLYITKAMDHYDASGGKNFSDALTGIDTKFLVMAFKSDWLYPAYQSLEIVRACKLAGIDAVYCEIDSTYGHDAFLLETSEETHLITHFLKKVYEGIK